MNEAIRSREREPIPGSIGFVFSGQGLSSRGALYEHVDALSSIDAAVVARNIALMEDVSGLPLFKYVAERNELVLDGTHVVQAIVHGLHLAAIELLAPKILETRGALRTAGHSAGEIAAMVVAGVLTPQDSAKVITERGKLMHRASQDTPSGLIIPLGFDLTKTMEVEDYVNEMLTYFQVEDTVEENRELFEAVAKAKQVSLDDLLDELQDYHFISIALRNEPNVNVLGGTKLALIFAKEVAQRNGARRVLDVDAEGAFHTEAMHTARQGLGNVFRRVPLAGPNFAVALNDGSTTNDPSSMVQSHLSSMTRTSEWIKTMDKFADLETVVKIGPGGQVPGVSEANGIPKDRQVSIVDFLAA